MKPLSCEITSSYITQVVCTFLATDMIHTAQLTECQLMAGSTGFHIKIISQDLAHQHIRAGLNLSLGPGIVAFEGTQAAGKQKIMLLNAIKNL